MNGKVQALKIEWTGKRLPKIVPLPIPFTNRSEQTGEVVCNPTGIFPLEEGERLLAMSGENGLFKLVDRIYETGSPGEPSKPAPIVKAEQPDETAPLGPYCACGCRDRIKLQPWHKNKPPRFIHGHQFKHKKTFKDAVPEPTGGVQPSPEIQAGTEE